MWLKGETLAKKRTNPRGREASVRKETMVIRGKKGTYLAI